MPIDISSVTVEFGYGVKREEYGPTKSAKVSLTGPVNVGEDGVVTLNYLTKIAQDKVNEMLGLSTGPATLATSTSTASAPTPRTRAKPAVSQEGKPPETLTDTELSSALKEASAGPAETSVSTAAADDWGTDAATREIPDTELTAACSAAAERLGDGTKVRDTIQLFNTKPAGERFSVTELPQGQRQAFLDKLKAL